MIYVQPSADPMNFNPPKLLVANGVTLERRALISKKVVANPIVGRQMAPVRGH